MGECRGGGSVREDMQSSIVTSAVARFNSRLIADDDMTVVSPVSLKCSVL